MKGFSVEESFLFDIIESMTADDAIFYFQTYYPGKNIISIPKTSPGEILCEI